MHFLQKIRQSLDSESKNCGLRSERMIPKDVRTKLGKILLGSCLFHQMELSCIADISHSRNEMELVKPARPNSATPWHKALCILHCEAQWFSNTGPWLVFKLKKAVGPGRALQWSTGSELEARCWSLIPWHHLTCSGVDLWVLLFGIQEIQDRVWSQVHSSQLWKSHHHKDKNRGKEKKPK